MDGNIYESALQNIMSPEYLVNTVLYIREYVNCDISGNENSYVIFFSSHFAIGLIISPMAINFQLIQDIFHIHT